MSDSPTMITVSTSGDFMLLDPFSGHEIPHDREVTVPLTSFVRDRLEANDLIELPAKPPAKKTAGKA